MPPTQRKRPLTKSTGPKINDVPAYVLEPIPGEDVARKDTVQFTFDGDLFTLRRPKMAIAIPLLNLATGEDTRTVVELGTDLVQLITGIMGYIQQEHPGPDGKIRGQALLFKRLSNPDDPLDILHLNRPFQDLMVRVFRNPTGSLPGSSAQQTPTSDGGADATP